jgi:hypothetical protein
MVGNFELAEVLADIRSLQAECELLLRIAETCEEGDALDPIDAKDLQPLAEFYYLA